MAERPEPYIRRDPGDVIRSGDWNELQVQAREEVHVHRHTGGVDGLKIPRDGIEAKAIDGSLIDPAAAVVLKKLNVSTELKVDAKSLLVDLAMTGKLGIGTNNPTDKLTIADGDVRIEGGKYRRLKIISDQYWAGIELVSRNQGEAGRPHIDFTHGDLDDPNFGIRMSAPDNDSFTIEGGNVGINTSTPKAALDINGGAFLGYETTLTDFGAIMQSGFYQNGGKQITGDVPDTSHSWTHMITARHSNQGNNHQLQIASSYAENNRIFFRKIAHSKESKNPAWHELATKEQEDWRAVSFLNGWTNYGGSYNPAGYFKDNMGMVHLRGLVKSGAIPKHIFILPTGFRPQYRELQPVQTNSNTIGRVDVLTDGRVHVTAGNAGWLSLDGITFRAYR